MFKTIEKICEVEITEKKSRFIANIFHVESVEEAEEKIKEIKKRYHDARHNCYAYSIFTENGNITKYYDDGEPSGTAGAPMLNILTSKEITNCVVIVTRYFGGILLGTGGLVRAYQEATQKAVSNVDIVYKDYGLGVSFYVTYSELDKLKYFLKQYEIKIVKVEYMENVEVTVDINKEQLKYILDNKDEFNFSLIDYKILGKKIISY